MAFFQPIATGAFIRLHPGFKFQPTDEDIVVRYLRPRAVNEPLPSEFIVDVDIRSQNPWDLVPERSMEKYFFSQRVPWGPHGNRCKRTAGAGYWKASGKDLPIFCNNVIGGAPLMVGMRKTLVFYHGKAGVGKNTEWVMQEYSLIGAGLLPYRVIRPIEGNGQRSLATAGITKKNNDVPGSLCNAAASLPKVPMMVNPDDSWVVCRIYRKRKHMSRIAKHYNIAGEGKVPFFNFLEPGNSKRMDSSSNLTQHLEEAKDDNTGSGGTDMKAGCSEAGKLLRLAP